MNKVDWENICTAPKPEWLAIPKEILTTRDKPFTFIFGDIVSTGLKSYVWDGTQTKQYCLSDCHLCAFTGYEDSKGEKVYGGHILAGWGRLFVVKWGVVQIDKIAPDGTENRVDCASFYFEVFQGGAPLYPIIHNFEGKHDLETLTIIGHIHIKPWPDEVRELLEKG